MDIFLQQLVNGLTIGSMFALIALGYTMVYGVMKLINFAHGDLVAGSAFVGLFVFSQLLGGEISLACCCRGLFTHNHRSSALLGFILERLAYRPLRNAPGFLLWFRHLGQAWLFRTASCCSGGLRCTFFQN